MPIPTRTTARTSASRCRTSCRAPQSSTARPARSVSAACSPRSRRAPPPILRRSRRAAIPPRGQRPALHHRPGARLKKRIRVHREVGLPPGGAAQGRHGGGARVLPRGALPRVQSAQQRLSRHSDPGDGLPHGQHGLTEGGADRACRGQPDLCARRSRRAQRDRAGRAAPPVHGCA